METTSLPKQVAKKQNIYEDIFNRQKAYFATNITRSYEWRVDQLNRLAQLLTSQAAATMDRQQRKLIDKNSSARRSRR